MLALLMVSHIDASKSADKDGDVTLEVDQKQFVNAVEVLRQHGFPRKQYVALTDLFPSNQLVTSPTQEKTKLYYLKEQQLESMLASMDGVISARVSIGSDDSTNDSGDNSKASVAVLMIYSPTVNMNNYEPQIRSLVQKGLPGIRPENVSVVLMPANYRLAAPANPTNNATSPASHLQWIWAGIAACVAVVLMLGAGFAWRRRNKTESKTESNDVE